MTSPRSLRAFALVTGLGLAMLAPVAGRAGVSAPVPVTASTCTPASSPSIVWVPTRGGDVYLRLWVPACPDAARATVPVLLTYTPYEVLYQGADPNPELARFQRRGYARAIADVIGTGNSGGCWDYGGARERASAYDLVEWLAAQTWSNGKVAMIGASYDGTTANMAAISRPGDPRPPHLATIVPQVAISDWYSYAYGDGIRYAIMDPAQRQGTVIDEQGLDTPGSFDFVEAAIPPADRGSDPKDPNLAQHIVERPCPGMTDKLEHTMRAYEPDSDYDAFWRARGYINDAASVDIPVLVEGGWRDYNVKHSESTRWFDALTNASYKMLVMGQQAHGLPDFGNADVLLHAWFDQFLYGYDTGITQQPGSSSKTNDGVVRSDASWPPEGTSDVPFSMSQGSLSASKHIDGGNEVATLPDPGTQTESSALAGAPGSMLLESAPLTSDLRIAGTPSLDLAASTIGTSAHFTPVLFDVGPPSDPNDSLCQFVPAQSACTLSRGFLNARYRDGLGTGVDLTPGGSYSAHVRFIDNDWVVKAGHRIGLALMSSNAWWATPDPERAPTSIEITSSTLSLPVVGGLDAARTAGL